MRKRAPFASRKKQNFRNFETLEPRVLLAAHIVGSSVVYSTIQAAVSAASTGAVINVDAGTYPELVTVNKTLTIRGAQAGVDARSNARQGGTGESIVTGKSVSDGTSSGFYIAANDVVIDGFTVQGNTSNATYGAGIVMAPNIHGTQILDNILQNNVSGLFLSNNSTTDPAVIQHNIFRNNNNNGTNGGRGIYTDESFFGSQLTNVTIDANAFFNNLGGNGTTGLESAIAIEPSTAGITSNIRITNNSMDDNGKGVLFFHTTGITITGNAITNTQDQYSGVLRFEGDDNTVTITNNTVYDNPGPAVAIDSKGVPGNDSGFVINYNNFYNNSTAYGNKISVIANASNYTGTLDTRNNWWGSASGPSGDGSGSGDAVWGNGVRPSGGWQPLSGGSAIWSPWSTAPNGVEDTPYYGTPLIAGFPIQAEDFNHGGNGVGYFTTSSSNGPGRYRPNEAIGIESTSDTGGGYDVTQTVAGEWLDYAINLTATGSYNMLFRIASAQSTGGKFHANIDGQNVTGTITVPNTGGKQTWQTVTINNVSLSAGQHVLRLVMDSTGSGGYVANFNWFELIGTSTSSVPTAPSNLTATAVSTSQINLSWANTAGTSETGFEIDRSPDGSNFSFLANVGASATTYSNTGLNPGTIYYYRVEALNSAGASPSSNIASATTQPVATNTVNLSSLTWVSATVGWGTIQKNLSIKGNPITLRGTVYSTGIGTHAVSQIVYNLGSQYSNFISDVGVDDETSGQGNVDFQVIGDGKVLFDSGVLTGTSTVVHINVSVGSVQQLTLIANNGVSGSIDYDHADWAGAQLVLAGNTAPAAPSGVVATPVSSSQINLTWTNNSANQTSIEIDRSLDGINFTPFVTNLSGSATSYSDTGLTASTTYYYRVIAKNSVGSSPASTIASALTMPAATAPAAPSNVVATPVSSSQINLTWTNNSTNQTSIEVDRSPDGVNFTPLVTTLSGSATSYSDTGLTASTMYYYRVIAKNSVGSSPASTVASALTMPAASTTTWLSSLNWTSATVGWGTIHKNQDIKGNPITLRGTVYSSGIGTHANSTITYNIAGQYSTFVSDIGIDDDSNGQGSVYFQVIADGKVLYTSGTLTGSSPVVHLNINVAGVQQLQLICNTATPGNIDYDHGDWAGAKLLS
jgi:hypothetical protein